MRILIVEPFKLNGGQEKFIVSLYNHLRKFFIVHVLCENSTNSFAAMINPDDLISIKKFKPLKMIFKYNLIILNGDRSLFLFWHVLVIKLIFLPNYPLLIQIKHLKFKDAIKNLNYGLRLSYSLAHKILIKSLDQIIAISKPIFVDLSSKKYSVVLIENGIDPLVPNNSNVGTKLVLGFVGRLDQQKGIHLIKNAAIQLNNRKDIEFVIYGEGPLQSELVGLGNVKLMGFTQNIQSAFDSIDVVLMPSIYEGLSLSLLEAMSAAKPIILSNIDSFSCILDHHSAIFFNCGDSDSFINAIERCFNKTVDLRKIGNNANKIFNNSYTQAKMLDKYVELIKLLAK